MQDQDPTPVERHFSLGEVARHLPKVEGRSISTTSIWRWCRKGAGPRRVKLRYIRLGRRIMVPASALAEFMKALYEADAPAPAPERPVTLKPPTPAVRAKQIRDADERCRRAGL